MSKSKSLGSSPIGFSSAEENSYHFIPDLGVNDTGKPEKINSNRDHDNELVPEVRTNHLLKNSEGESKSEPDSVKKNKKQIVSYYLEEKLVSQIKVIADQNGLYYSSLVSDALKYWLNHHNYN